MTSSDPDQRLSEHLVRLVQVVFAMVLAQSLFLFRAVLVDPFQADNRVAALALVAVFTTTVLSWVDWHTTMVFSAYETRHRAEKVRLFADLMIVVLYAYLLFTIEPFVGHPARDLRSHLRGYPIVFFGYVLSGATRRLNYGIAASRLKPIAIFFFIYSVLWFVYSQLWQAFSGPDPAWLVTLNLGTLGIVLLIMIEYRLYRARYRDQMKNRKKQGLVIGVDVDGVLADQITGVLPIVKKRHGVELRYEDITHWRLPVGSTDIAAEIEHSLQDRTHVMKMRAHRGAFRLLSFLYKSNRVLIVTARSEASRDWSRAWLNMKMLPYDEIESSAEAKKSVHGVQVLIDDYLGNVLEFLTNTTGAAVLVDQPWNRDRRDLQPFIEQGRAFVAHRLTDVVAQWPKIAAAVPATTAESPVV